MGVVWQKKFASHAERDVMMALADHADDHGICWPAQGYVAWKVERHPDTVKAAMKTFRDQEIIEIVGRAEGGRSRSPVYRIHPEKLPDKEPYERGGGRPPVLDGEVKGGVTDRKGGMADPPEPSEEPSAGYETEVSRGIGPTPLEKHITNMIYDRMKAEGMPWTGEEYGFHLGRVKWMIEHMEPSDIEVEMLPAAFVTLYAITPKTDAAAALREVRRNKMRQAIMEERERARDQAGAAGGRPPERLNPFADTAMEMRDELRGTEWYGATFGDRLATDHIERAVTEAKERGVGHEELVKRLSSDWRGARDENEKESE